jgi:hypothetical protein
VIIAMYIYYDYVQWVSSAGDAEWFFVK